MRRRILVDTDTASDDAVALIMALRSPLVEVVAITVVAGNVPMEQGTRNALLCVELCKANVPVYAGATKPLERELVVADWFHGRDGLSDRGYRPRTQYKETMHAADAIIAAAEAYPGLEIITLGPLTNLAMAVAGAPHIVEKIGRCVVMGGNPSCEGNVTPAAEFNIWVDPEAAQAVFLSGLSIEMVGWHLSRWDAVLNEGDIVDILALQSPLAEFAIGCNQAAAEGYFVQTGQRGISLPDPVAMAILLQPELCTGASLHRVQIETASALTRGMTVVDRLDVGKDPRNIAEWKEAFATASATRVCWTLDATGWKRALIAALKL